MSMILRWMTALGLSTAILLVLAIPLSLIPVTFRYAARGDTLDLYIADGSVGMQFWGKSRPWDEFTAPYSDISVGSRSSLRNGLPSWHWFRPEFKGSFGATGSSAASVPLLYLLILAILPAVLLRLRNWRLNRRRRRLGLCSHCGYDLRSSGEKCPECGTLREPETPDQRCATVHATSRQVLVALTAWLTAIVAALLSLNHSERTERERIGYRVLDYTGYVNRTTPRLNGRVLTLQPGVPPQGEISPGSLVILGEGDFDFERNLVALDDVLIVGRGSDQSRLTIHIGDAHRVCISGVTIDCTDDPFFEPRREGQLQLSDCKVTGYNSGAGGSNAVAGEAAMLVENCEFDGVRGRGGSLGHRGNAFSLSQEAPSFVRGTKFVDNGEVGRGVFGVFDDCQVVGQRTYGVTPGGAHTFARNCGPGFFVGTPKPFSLSTDDPAYVRAARDGSSTGDALADRMLRLLGSRDDPRYWLALLRSGDAEIRGIARKMLETSGFGKALAEPFDIRAALAQIAEKSPESDELRLRILANGESALEVLDKAARGLSGDAAAEAQRLRDLLTAHPELNREAVFSIFAREIDGKP